MVEPDPSMLERPSMDVSSTRRRRFSWTELLTFPDGPCTSVEAAVELRVTVDILILFSNVAIDDKNE